MGKTKTLKTTPTTDCFQETFRVHKTKTSKTEGKAKQMRKEPKGRRGRETV